MSPLEITGFALSVVGVWLTARQHILCWPVGIASVVVYAVVFVDVKLYSDAALQVVFALLQAYGWYAWLQAGPVAATAAVVSTQRAHRPVSRARVHVLLGLLLAGAAATLALGHLMATRTDAALPYWDAGTTAYSLVAQWLTATKAIECWPLWIAVDAVYIGIYIVKDLHLTAVLYALFIALAAYGWRQWHSDLRPERVR